MKRVIAFALTLAMLVTLLPVGVLAQSSDTGVAVKPFYTVNWNETKEALDYVYDMPYTWSSGAVTEGEDGTKSMTVSIGKYGLSDPAALAAAMKKDFDARPEGSRILLYTAMTDVFKKQVVDVVDFRVGIEAAKNWLTNFLAEYSAIGGKLDGIALDLEYNSAYTNYIHTAWYEGDEDIYAVIANNEYYNTVIRPILVERDFTFWTATEGDYMSELWSIHKDDGYAESRKIWDDLMSDLLVQHINEAVWEPLHDAYPEARLSDYHTVDYQGWLKGAGAAGGATTGNSIKVGNTSAYSAVYAASPEGYFYKNSLTDKNRTKYTSPVGFNDAVWEATPFNMAMWDVNRFKTMLAATDDNLDAWIAGYNYGSNIENSISNTPYYSEIILHLGLLDANFLGFILEGDVTKKGGDYQYALEVVNDLMSELTRVAGDVDRATLKDQNLASWNGSYMLTGMSAGGRNIWRLTPDTTVVSVEDFLVEGDVPTFQIGGLTITFPQGRIIEDGDIREVGTCGYWIETPEGVEPVVTADADRYSADPAFLETFENFEAKLTTDTYWTVSGSAAVQNGALALTGDDTITNVKVPKNITAGDDYAAQQAWEITVTLPELSEDAAVFLLDGFKIMGGKVSCNDYVDGYVDAGSIAAGTYTLKRVVNFADKTSSYYINGSLVAEGLAMDTTAVTEISAVEVCDTDQTVLVDDYKLYPVGMQATFEVYETTFGNEVDTTSTVSGKYAYRASWLNASDKAQKVTIKNGSTVLDTITVAPGMDGWTYGVIESDTTPSALTYTVEETTYTAPEISTDTSWEGMNENLGITCIVVDKGYATLAEAVAAATSGQTVMLLEDAQIATSITVDKSIAIRSNGFAINSTAADAAFVVAAGGQLTVDDSITLNAGEATALKVTGGILNVNGGEITGKNGIVVTGGTLNMTAGTVTATENAIVLNQDAAKTPATINVTGGTLAGEKVFYHYNTNDTASTNVTATFSGVTYTGKAVTDEEHFTIMNSQNGFYLHGHTVVVIDGKEATCTEPGLSEGLYYSCCGIYVAEQVETPYAHNWTAGDDCYALKVCADCGATGSEVTGHTFVKNEDGSHTCSVCGYGYTGTVAHMYYITKGQNGQVGNDRQNLYEGTTYYFTVAYADSDNPTHSYVLPVTDGSVDSNSDSYIKLSWPAGGTPTLTLKNVELKNVFGLTLGGFYAAKSATMDTKAAGHNVPYNVELIGTNKITAVYGNTNASYGPLEFVTYGETNIYGSGTLELVSDKKFCGSMTSYGDINFFDADVTLSMPDSTGYANGIQTYGGDITVDGAKLTIVSLDDPGNGTGINETVKYVFNADGNITVKNGAKVDVDVHAYDGIFTATGDITVADSDVDIKNAKGTPVFNKMPTVTGSDIVAATTVSSLNAEKTELVAPSSTTAYTAEEFAAIEDITTLRYFSTTHTCVAGETGTLLDPEFNCSTTQTKVSNCTICGAEMTSEVPVASSAEHTLVTVKENYVPATTSADGSYDLVTKCSVCGEVTATEAVVLAKFTTPYLYYIPSANASYNDNNYVGNYSVKLSSASTVHYFTVQKPYADAAEGDTAYTYKDNAYLVPVTDGSVTDESVSYAKFAYGEDGIPTLTLKNIDIRNDFGLTLGGTYYVKSGSTYTGTHNTPYRVELIGNNTITNTTNSAAVYGGLDFVTLGDAEITSIDGGTLTVYSNRRGGTCGAIYSVGDITFNEANVTVELNEAYNKDNAIATEGSDIIVKGGSLTINAVDNPDTSGTYNGEAMYSAFYANNLTVQDGAKLTMVVSPYQKTAMQLTGTFTVENADVELALAGTLSSSKLFNAEQALVISDGSTVVASATKGTWTADAGYTAPTDAADYAGTEDLTTLKYFKITHTCEKGEYLRTELPEQNCYTKQAVVYACVHCGAEIFEYEDVTASAAHTPGTAEEIARVEATASSDGYYVVQTTCTVCGEVLSEETVVLPAKTSAKLFYQANSSTAYIGSGWSITLNPGETKYMNVVDGYTIPVTDDTVPTDNYVKFDYTGDVATLTLHNAEISNTLGLILGQNYAASKVTTATHSTHYRVVLEGTNTITATNRTWGHGLSFLTTGNTTISGDGTLTVNAGAINGTTYGVLTSYGDIIFAGADVKLVLSESSGKANAIASLGGDVIVDNAKLTILGCDDDATSPNGGTTHGEAMYAAISAGTVDIKNGSDVTVYGTPYNSYLVQADAINIADSTAEFAISDWSYGNGLFSVAPTLSYSAGYIADASANVADYDSTAETYTVTTPESTVIYDEAALADYNYFTVAAHEHKSTTAGVVTAPNCTEKGYTTYTCDDCGREYKADETDLADHVWADATCTTPKTCTICGTTEGDPLGHNYVAVVTDPTCTEAGYTTHTCSACGLSFTSNKVDALGHTEVTDKAVAATCTKPGLTAGKTCSVCGEITVAQEEVPALGHTWTDATCTTAKTCSVCGETEGEALGHTNDKYTDNGDGATHTVACSVCGETVNASETHTYVDGTCACGAEDAGCSNGEHADSASDADHVCDGGCGKVMNGCADTNKDYKCDVCGGTMYIRPAGAALLYNDLIQIRYKYTINLTGVEEFGAWIFSDETDEAAKAAAYTFDAANAAETLEMVYDSSSGTSLTYYAFTAGIAAKNMGDAQYMVTYVKLADGSYRYTEPVEYSPKQYAANMVGKATTDEKTKTLCAALMHYGAAHQQYTGYRTDALMNADFGTFTYDESVLGESVFSVDTNTVNGIKSNGATLIFTGALTYRYKYTPSGEALGKTLYAEYTVDVNNETVTEDIELVQDGSAYYAFVSGVPAKDMDSAMTIRPYYLDENGEKVYGPEVVYSGYEYCRRTIENANNTEAAKNLAKAFAMYVFAADAAITK